MGISWWFKLCASTSEGLDSISGWGTKQATQPKKKKKDIVIQIHFRENEMVETRL